MVRRRLVKIADLKFDSRLYPRLKVGWLTAYGYAQAMRAGQKFPPVSVGVYKGVMYVTDGWHRIEARKMIGEEYIDAVLTDYKNERDMFADAVRANNSHGRPLSSQEKAWIIDRLKDFQFSTAEISNLVAVPLDKFSVFTSRILALPNGEKIYLKSPLAKAEVENPEKVDQSILSGVSAINLLSQLVELLKTNALNFEEPHVKELAIQLFDMLQDVLKLA